LNKGIQKPIKWSGSRYSSQTAPFSYLLKRLTAVL